VHFLFLAQQPRKVAREQVFQIVMERLCLDIMLIESVAPVHGGR